MIMMITDPLHRAFAEAEMEKGTGSAGKGGVWWLCGMRLLLSCRGRSLHTWFKLDLEYMLRH